MEMKLFYGGKTYLNYQQVELQTRSFISELKLWLDHFNRETCFNSVALKVFVVTLTLLMQKPSRNSKAKNHLNKLDERLMNLWREGKYPV